MIAAPITTQPQWRYVIPFRVWGIAHICFGAAIFLEEVFGYIIFFLIKNGSPGSDIYMGIWAGAIFMGTGALGVQASRFPAKGVIIAGLVMSVISGLLSLGVLILAIRLIVVYHSMFPTEIWVLSVLNIIIGLGETIVATVFTGYCSAVVCCGKEGYAAVSANAVPITYVANQPATQAADYPRQAPLPQKVEV
uniref:Uncharacterized LOC100181219 n=1 Tax=Ciona intestinalis TaxID=7719 RepID=H2XPU7_CIOIN|nr:uncharacterized protein LOC100181219 isoform X1 [Ciona intestinalis]|eukprot:XP_009862152.1 uncharacterized protein LOC100181219 isoform X1 [Ciona intestinalis]